MPTQRLEQMQQERDAAVKQADTATSEVTTARRQSTTASAEAAAAIKQAINAKAEATEEAAATITQLREVPCNQLLLQVVLFVKLHCCTQVATLCS